MTWSLRALRWSFCAYIAWSSLQTFAGARTGHAALHAHALLLSGAELLAIAAFLFERSALPACVALVAIFAIAAVLTALAGQTPLRFLYFAATAVHIVLAQRASTGPAPEPRRTPAG
ncbi:MAG TPA: hypothetical protein VGH03_15800 [Caulobacteraceae bacterium]|jgi:hypothetical protein